MSIPKPSPSKPSLTAVTFDHPANTKPTVEFFTLTPAHAEKFLSRNTSNRNIRPGKVREYARDMRNGKWLPYVQAIAFDWNGTMINGQHTCQAAIESGASVKVILVKGLDPDTRDVMDTGSKRTAADALKLRGSDGNHTILSAMARIALARESGYFQKALSASNPAVTHGEVIEWVENHSDAVHAAALAQRTARAIGAKPGVLAYCVYVLQHIDASAATEFFTSMAEFRTGGAGDPRRLVLDQFRSAESGARRRHSAAETIYLIFTAWNAWAQGKKLTSTKPRGMNGDPAGAVIPLPVKPTRVVS